MSESSLSQRVARAVGESPFSEKLADAQSFIYKPVIDWAVGSPFHTTILGHSVHPAYTDLTLGCWGSASILDLAGGTQSRRSAAILVGVGVAAAMPTAFQEPPTFPKRRALSVGSPRFMHWARTPPYFCP